MEVLKNLVADMNERMELVLAHRFQQSRRREAPSTAELTQVSFCELTPSHLSLDSPQVFLQAVFSKTQLLQIARELFDHAHV